MTVGLLCSPTFVLAKVMMGDAGEMVTGGVPTPDRGTSIGPPGASGELITNVPVRVPDACGENVIESLHDPRAAIGGAHPVTEKSFVLPRTDSESELTGLDWLFESVIVFATLVVPCICVANTALVGLTAKASTPFPVIATACGLVTASCVMINVSFSALSVCGVNTTVNMQELCGARVPSHPPLRGLSTE